ncbi:MAG: dihydropteroate synthase [Candidatus Omnitrophota bacterium]
MKIIPLKIKNQKQAEGLMSGLGVSPEGIKILSPKSVYSVFKIEGIKSWEANIIKQHLLSLGADAAIERKALIKDIKTSVFIFANVSQLKELCRKLKIQPFNLKKISEGILSCLDELQKEEFKFLIKGKTLKIKKPLVCGIINITDDSFSGDGALSRAKGLEPKIKDLILDKAGAMIRAGAKIIDLGGESSRPFSKPVNEKEEIKRIIPLLKALRKRHKNILISVDTYKYNVAKEAAGAGADIINDITALRHSPNITFLIKKYKLGCILMHMKGTPKTMQINPEYKDVMEEEIDFFQERLNFCAQRGVVKEQLFIDPGIGFGKRVEDNLKIINQLYKLKIFGRPIFLGLSKKAFIGKILNRDIDRRLNGTIAANVVSFIRGADILRVHDVPAAVEALKMASAIDSCS